MPITDSLVLPADVLVVPTSKLPTAVRRQLGAGTEEFAVTRRSARAPSKIVTAASAHLLELFRNATSVADAVVTYSRHYQLDAEELLGEAFPVIRDCFNAGFLVPAGSPSADEIAPTLNYGERIGEFTVLRCVQALDDTEVYQGRRADGTVVAVKIVRPGANRLARAMLKREAATLRCLDGVAAPRLLASATVRRRPYVALAWRPGVSPEVAFAEARELPGARGRRAMLRLAVAVLDAYGELHARGVIHGDVHPGNLLIDATGNVVVLDFGLAVIATTAQRRPGPRGGVPFYYPPEYAKALLNGTRLPPPSTRSEQYSLAALLYLLFTGEHYLDFSLEQAASLERILTKGPLPFSRRGARPWGHVEAVLARALSKSPLDRFETVAAMAEALGAAPCNAPRPRGAERDLLSALVGGSLERLRIPGPLFADDVPTPPMCSATYGAAGTAYALYRTACVRDDAALLALADGWLTRAEAKLSDGDAFMSADLDITPETVGSVSPYHAASGVHLVRVLIGQALGDLAASQRAVSAFVDASSVPCREFDLTLGRAGTLLGCSLVLEALPPDLGNDPLLALAHRMLGQLWSEVDALAPTPTDPRFPRIGMAHGWAGLIYATLRWCRTSGAEIPGGLQRRLDELTGCALEVGRGVRWRGGFNETPVSGWCNGSAGLVHLWTLAHSHFGDDRFLTLAERSAWNAWEDREGWSDLCCGRAGRAYALINFYKHTGDHVWVRRARNLAIGSARELALGTWIPRHPMSLFKGELGVALLAADLERAEGASMPLFEHEGWPERAGARRG